MKIVRKAGTLHVFLHLETMVDLFQLYFLKLWLLVIFDKNFTRAFVDKEFLIINPIWQLYAAVWIAHSLRISIDIS